MLSEQGDKVAHCRDNRLARFVGVDFRDLERVADEVLEVAYGVAEIDGVVDVADYRLVGSDDFTERLR